MATEIRGTDGARGSLGKGRSAPVKRTLRARVEELESDREELLRRFRTVLSHTRCYCGQCKSASKWALNEFWSTVDNVRGNQ